MAALDLEEQEQLAAFKAWWQDNGTWLIGTLLLCVLVVGGWKGWQYYQNKQANESAVMYGEFVKQVESNDIKRVNDAATMVMDKYAGSAYASRAALLAAQFNEEAKDVAKAKTQLQWVVDHSAEAGLQDVARLRLTAILLDEKKYEEAIKLLDAKHQASFDGLFADLKGDVLSAQGKVEEAKTSYKLAYEKVDAKGSYRSLIQMKMDALGTTTK
jgi:predicted negative regulator of RcsB-dependent stress response